MSDAHETIKTDLAQVQVRGYGGSRPQLIINVIAEVPEGFRIETIELANGGRELQISLEAKYA